VPYFSLGIYCDNWGTIHRFSILIASLIRQDKGKLCESRPVPWMWNAPTGTNVHDMVI
jgi:hypothetical protein